MRRRVALWTALSAIAPACAAPPPPSPPPPPPPLAVRVPADSSVVYVRSDTAVVELDAQGQTFTLNAMFDATVGARFAPAPEGVRVTVTFEDFQGTVSNPLAGSQTATEEEISGPLVFTVDPRGHATVVSRPEIRGAATEFLSGERFAAELFPLLPGRAVVPGDSWTDTVRIESDAGSTRLVSRTVLRSRAIGDTLVDGRSYLLVRFAGEAERNTQSSQGGFDMSQAVAGTIEGHFLWDLQRSLLRSSESRADLRGTMEVSAAPFPLSVRVRSTSRTALKGS